jgi:hypothetical protein
VRNGADALDREGGRTMSAAPARRLTLDMTEDEIQTLVLQVLLASTNREPAPYWLCFSASPGRVEFGLRVGGAAAALIVELDLEQHQAHVCLAPDLLRPQLEQIKQASLESPDSLEREAEHGGLDVMLWAEGLLARAEELCEPE